METITTTTNAADIQSAATKRCPKCGEVLPITEFHKHSKSKDGLQSWCKHCSKIANATSYSNKKSQITPPQSVTSPHPIFSKMVQREIIAEIRERINYLRSKGWTFDGHLEYTETKTVKL